MLLLDTARHPAADREPAVRAVVEQMSVPTDVSLPVPDLVTRMDVVQLGEVSALRNLGCPVRLLRTSRHVRRDAPEVVSLILQLRGRAVHHQEGQTQIGRVGELVLADLSGPYESDTGLATAAMYLPHALLGLDVDVGRRAISCLPRSPVYDLVRRHLAVVERDIDRLSSGIAARAVGESTVQLVRALLLTAADDPGRHDALHETLRMRIEDHIAQNLGDGALTPERIARQHHISVRTLYNLWSGHEVPLMEWIIQRRLDRARADLGTPTPSGALPPIAAVARRWGFRDATHFSRRFRRRFGTAPLEWQARIGTTGTDRRP